MTKNRICELLGIRYPIIQAPMNWVSGADLVAAVSKAGGLGTLGPNSGADSITLDDELTGEKMRDQIKKVRQLNELAAMRGQSMAQLAIAWTLRDPRVTSALIGARTPEQVADCAGALANLSFTDEELDAIDTITRDP